MRAATQPSPGSRSGRWLPTLQSLRARDLTPHCLRLRRYCWVSVSSVSSEGAAGRIGVAVLAALVAAGYALDAPLTAIWLAGALLSALLSFLEWGRPQTADVSSPPAPSVTAPLVLAGLSVLCLAAPWPRIARTRTMRST